MKELTLRAVLLGLVMTVVLGAANAYLGLHAGQTIAATYPAAVIGMAFLRAFKKGEVSRLVVVPHLDPRALSTVHASRDGASRYAFN